MVDDGDAAQVYGCWCGGVRQITGKHHFLDGFRCSAYLMSVAVGAGGKSEAIDEMVIDESCSLHVSINDRGAHELEASRLQVPAQQIGLGACRGYVALRPPAIDDRFAADESPDVVSKAPEFLLDLEIVPRIADRRLDLSSVSYDAGVGHEPFNGAPVKARNTLGIEVGECATITGTLAQNRSPIQAGLRAFEDQKLEVRSVIMDGNAPFGVVVVQELLVDALTPRTSSHANGLVV